MNIEVPVQSPIQGRLQSLVSNLVALVDDQHVKVQLHRTGGFAGLAGTASLDSRDLDEAAAAALRQLVTKLDMYHS
jgi:hypothetical protein